MVNGITVGNGNLEYTVTQDTVNSRHTVRGESISLKLCVTYLPLPFMSITRLPMESPGPTQAPL